MTSAAKDPKGSITFPVPLFPGRVLICQTRNAYQIAHKQLYGHEYEDVEGVRGLSSKAIYNRKVVYLVGVFDRCDSTLVHELLHTSMSVLKYAGVPISKKNDEVLAYLMDSLFEASKTAMKKVRR